MHFLTSVLILFMFAISETIQANSCIPVPLYRMRYKKPVGGLISYFDSTSKDGGNCCVLDRQIATICSRNAPGTIPLFKGSHSYIYRHITTTTKAESGLDKFYYEVLGYVYTEKKQWFFPVYGLIDQATHTSRLTSNLKSESTNVYERDLFWSMPLCNPTPLYRMRRNKLVGNIISYFDSTSKDEGMYYLFDRQIATICTVKVPGTVPLYFGSHPYIYRYITTTSKTDPGFENYNFKILGYVFPEQQSWLFPVYRLIDQTTQNRLTSDIKSESTNVYERDLFWSLPM